MEQPTWIGRSLNSRYKIDALLGSGGMSAVYKALDPNLKRVVAIKLIHPHLSDDDEFIYRFKKEAAAVAAFRHPNIVQVFDFNNDGDVYYMVLEFVPGETLQDRLKHLKQSNTLMPIDQAVKIIINICDALAYAHKLGTVHRDIKPANIMLDLQGQAILMDFGIVKIIGDTSHTATGAVVGTARYMSPEVIRSEVADERSDIYSLGVAFFEMLSGQPPFNADSAMSLLMRHLNDPVPDINSLRADTPNELKRIVNKALEKDRDKRYRSADEMSGDLKRFLAVLEPATAPLSDFSPKPDTATTTPKPDPTPEPEAATEPWVAPKSSANEFLNEDAAVNEEPIPVAVPDVTKKAQSAHEPETVKHQPKAEAEPVISKPATSTSPLIKFGAIGLVVLLIVVAGIYFMLSSSRGASETATQTASVELTQNGQALPFAQQTSDAQTQSAASAITLEPTNPAATATETLVPPTPTPSTPYVRITDITLENDKYVVNYEVHNFPDAPSLHVHMFFNTVPPDQAGVPASGSNWKLTWGSYGDPPFTQYGPVNRPAQATQMCALVANANHTVIQGSGNCFDLPN